MIRDRIVLGIRSKDIRARLIREPRLNLNGAIEKCRSAEAADHQLRRVGAAGPQEESVNFARHHRKNPRALSKNKWLSSKNICRYCGQDRHRKKEDCHALGAKCGRCGEKNHFAKVCQNQERKEKNDHRRDKKTDDKKRHKNKKVHQIEKSGLEEDDYESSEESAYRVEQLGLLADGPR